MFGKFEVYNELKVIVFVKQVRQSIFAISPKLIILMRFDTDDEIE